MPRPVHPGRILKREMEARGLNPHRLALALAVPANRITAIVNRTRGISAETALRLARHFGNDARFWMNLQTGHDIAVAERDMGKDIAREVRAAWPPPGGERITLRSSS